MARTKHLVVGNWKMYIETLSEAKSLAGSVARTASRLRHTEAVICPPHPFVGALSASIRRGRVRLGAQDVSAEREAKRTGETSVSMLKDLGVAYVIVGHSERRALGETDTDVAAKAAQVLKAGLVPIICIGERERDIRGEYLASLQSQLRASLSGVPKAKATRLVIAYEPLWAIGKSSSDALPPRLLHEMALFIKKTLVSLYGRSAGTSVRIIYGGSVEAPNAGALAREGAVDGFLVGHASADAGEFAEILRSVDRR
ncbi:MAG TPA: triose-phosphate isomerase family protein [Candidatus Paceibacterota bacterium]|nr:triose-phosphate isomerase family protein [Candidatus Paceibacterota bacterium]